MAENFKKKTVSETGGPISLWGILRKSLLFAEISMIAYFDEKRVVPEAESMGFHHIDFVDLDGAQAYIFSNDIDIVIACRGTETNDFNDIKADLKVLPILAETIGRVHRGFKKEVDDLWPAIEKKIIHSEKKLWFCGHSLGGAMATICAGRCMLSHIKSNPIGLFTYGSPRVGTKKYVNHCVVNHTRWINNNDIVTRVPPMWMGYRHVGEEKYLNAYGKIRKMSGFQRVKDRIRGFFIGLGQGRIDHFSDHRITIYVEYIKEALEESGEH